MAVDPQYCLLFVNLFTPKIYTYPTKTRNLLGKKTQIFYNDIAKKRDITNIMRLQADLEFQQKQIKKLMKSITLKYVAADYMVERHLSLSK